MLSIFAKSDTYLLFTIYSTLAYFYKWTYQYIKVYKIPCMSENMHVQNLKF